MNRQPILASLNLHKSVAFTFAVIFFSLSLMGTARAVSGLDQTFGFGGMVVTDFSHYQDIVYDMVIQPDGKIVVVGVTGFINGSNTYDTNFSLARYNSNGSLDTSFGTGGRVSTDFRNTDDIVYSVALQPDGKIVAAGISLRSANYFPSADFAVARYNSNGSLDSSFGTGGKVTIDFSTTEDVATAVVIQQDNKIVLGGYSNVNHTFGWDMDFAITRFNSNGTLDTTFDGDGMLTTDIIGGFAHSEDRLAALALDSNGKIVAAGSSPTSNQNIIVARYNLDGTLDSTFDTDGKVSISPFGENVGGTVRSMLIQPDGRILLAASTGYNSTSTLAFGLARFNPDGSLDPTLDGDGTVVTPPNGESEYVTDLSLADSGKIVAVGHTAAGSYIVARYFSDGSLDPVFGNRGKIFTYMSLNSAPANAIAVQADGKILVAGQTTAVAPEHCDFLLARYVANPTSIATRSDFDGDGRSDFTVFRPADGTWYVINSSNGGYQAQPFGTVGDVAAPGDFDGDGGRTDFAVFRPSNGNWYILNSSDNSFRAVHFGANGDVPVAADYDGDAKTDIAVFRPSNGYWYILQSSDNAFRAQPFGIGTDHPVVGYYDTDEKADIAVYRDGTWYALNSSNNAVQTYYLGISGDQPVPGDYDTDGRMDIAVFRPSTGFWYIVQSRFGGSINYVRWGELGDIAVPGDFNGDSVMDVAVWTPSTGNWYRYYSSGIRWGMSGDMPVLKAYLP